MPKSWKKIPNSYCFDSPKCTQGEEKIYSNEEIKKTMTWCTKNLAATQKAAVKEGTAAPTAAARLSGPSAPWERRRAGENSPSGSRRNKGSEMGERQSQSLAIITEIAAKSGSGSSWRAEHAPCPYLVMSHSRCPGRCPTASSACAHSLERWRLVRRALAACLCTPAPKIRAEFGHQPTTTQADRSNMAGAANTPANWTALPALLPTQRSFV